MSQKYLNSIFSVALSKVGIDNNVSLIFDIPKIESHGDISCNIAMQLAKELKKSPNEIANLIVNNLIFDKEIIESVNIANPGFININFTQKYFFENLLEVFDKKIQIGHQEIGKNIKVNIEYVSANPTGLLHLGHGRNACLGDTIANLYQWLGYEVTKEYYFNNAGNQMNNLTLSIYSRYRQSLDNPEYPFPENGYFGDYIKTIANELIEKYNDKLINNSTENLAIFKKYGEEWCFKTIENTLDKMNIKQDVFYNEDSLYTDGKIQTLLEDFEKKGLSYHKDGAVWLKLSEMGLEDDRVIVKSSGEPTYRLPDIAYHREKFARGFDLLIDIFGADHIATIPDVVAALKSFGFTDDKIKIVIHQFVTLTENGEQVKMSKRTGKSYTLDELLEEVGADVVRFFFIMRSCNTHLEFDLALAKEQGDKNPVFYLQYAHARCCSVINNLLASEFDTNFSNNLNLNQLIGLELNQYEIKLIKSMMLFEETIQIAATKTEPYILVEFLKDFASNFHNFYHNCRVIDSELQIQQLRYILLEISKRILKNGLTILGVSSPEKM